MRRTDGHCRHASMHRDDDGNEEKREDGMTPREPPRRSYDGVVVLNRGHGTEDALGAIAGRQCENSHEP